MGRGSVRDILDQNPELSWQMRYQLLTDAAKGMEYLHSKHVIHRDLKSQNLLVDDMGVCKVADFGISTIKPSVTRTMTSIGTPVYMAPEVIARDKYSEKADVYSFGVLVVEVATGLLPYSTGEFAKINSNRVCDTVRLLYRTTVVWLID
jgi:serine/threonine protein kinase